MSTELIGIISVGVALFVGLGGMILAGRRATDRRIEELSQSVDRRIEELSQSVAGIDRRLARVEGLLEGLGLRHGEVLASGD